MERDGPWYENEAFWSEIGFEIFGPKAIEAAKVEIDHALERLAPTAKEESSC